MRERREQDVKTHTAAAQTVAHDFSVLGRAGVALVEFNLLRRGVECFRTPEGSASGDIWAETALGRISIEVKTTQSRRSWRISLAQNRSEFYVLVLLDRADCWVLSRSTVEALGAQDRIDERFSRIARNKLPPDSHENWAKLGVDKSFPTIRQPAIAPLSDGVEITTAPHRPHYLRSYTTKDGTVRYSLKRGTGWPNNPQIEAALKARIQQLREQGLLRWGIA